MVITLPVSAVMCLLLVMMDTSTTTGNVSQDWNGMIDAKLVFGNHLLVNQLPLDQQHKHQPPYPHPKHLLWNQLQVSYVPGFWPQINASNENSLLRIPAMYEVKNSKICNFWTFWPVIQLINHLFQIRHAFRFATSPPPTDATFKMSLHFLQVETIVKKKCLSDFEKMV